MSALLTSYYVCERSFFIQNVFKKIHILCAGKFTETEAEEVKKTYLCEHCLVNLKNRDLTIQKHIVWNRNMYNKIFKNFEDYKKIQKLMKTH